MKIFAEKAEEMDQCPLPYQLSPEMEEKVNRALYDDAGPLSSLFKVLSDPLRLRILKALQVCELCVCVLVQITDYKYPALSYHLKLLKDEGLVESHREGSFQIYHLTQLGAETIRFIESLRK